MQLAAKTHHEKRKAYDGYEAAEYDVQLEASQRCMRKLVDNINDVLERIKIEQIQLVGF